MSLGVLAGQSLISNILVDQSFGLGKCGVDVGAVYMTARYGHSVERRIDEQESKRQGHTVYLDTNNSTNDFIEREQASLRDK